MVVTGEKLANDAAANDLRGVRPEVGVGAVALPPVGDSDPIGGRLDDDFERLELVSVWTDIHSIAFGGVTAVHYSLTQRTPGCILVRGLDEDKPGRHARSGLVPVVAPKCAVATTRERSKQHRFGARGVGGRGRAGSAVPPVARRNR